MTLPARAIGPFTVSAIGLGRPNLDHVHGTPAPLRAPIDTAPLPDEGVA